jgi:hypothetical protein
MMSARRRRPTATAVRRRATAPAPAVPVTSPQAHAGRGKGAAKPAGARQAAANPASPNAKPPARSDAETIAQAIYGPDERSPTPPAVTEDGAPLRYGDGAAVDANNVAEAETFRRYVAEKNTPPASKSALQAYYRQQKSD